MNINYNVSGEKRKELVKAMGEILQAEPVYMGAPTFSYSVGEYVVNKDGVVTIPDPADNAAVQALLDRLAEDYGFQPESPENGQESPDTGAESSENDPADEEAETETAKEKPADEDKETEPAEDEAPLNEESPVETEDPDCDEPICEEPIAEEAQEDEPIKDTEPEAPLPDETAASVPEPATNPISISDDDYRLTVCLPLKDLTDTVLANIQNIVDSKQTVLKKALDAEDLPIEIREDTLAFPWFTLHNMPGEVDAYQQLVYAIVKQAKERKRTKSEELENSNDKYVMRMFLIRLGFIGEEYKTARKLLMRNLSGNCSWKSGTPPAKADPVEERDAE